MTAMFKRTSVREPPPKEEAKEWPTSRWSRTDLSQAQGPAKTVRIEAPAQSSTPVLHHFYFQSKWHKIFGAAVPHATMYSIDNGGRAKAGRQRRTGKTGGQGRQAGRQGRWAGKRGGSSRQQASESEVKVRKYTVLVSCDLVRGPVCLRPTF